MVCACTIGSSAGTTRQARWRLAASGSRVWYRSVSCKSWRSPLRASGASTPRTSTGRDFGERLAVPRWIVSAERQERSPICGILRCARAS